MARSFEIFAVDAIVPCRQVTFHKWAFLNEHKKFKMLNLILNLFIILNFIYSYVELFADFRYLNFFT